jgi:hypothetical protein
MPIVEICVDICTNSAIVGLVIIVINYMLELNSVTWAYYVKTQARLDTRSVFGDGPASVVRALHRCGIIDLIYHHGGLVIVDTMMSTWERGPVSIGP